MTITAEEMEQFCLAFIGTNPEFSKFLGRDTVKGINSELITAKNKAWDYPVMVLQNQFFTISTLYAGEGLYVPLCCFINSEAKPTCHPGDFILTHCQLAACGYYTATKNLGDTFCKAREF